MSIVRLVLWLLVTTTLGAESTTELWNSRMGKGDGAFEAQSFRLVRNGEGVVETHLPARGNPQSTARVEMAAGRLVRSRTDYLVPELSQWYRADFLLTEAQSGAGEGGRDNLAFQRVWKGEVQEAKNLAWGPEFVEFSTLPFLLEQKLSEGTQDWSFRTYSADIPGDMRVRVQRTNHPLEVERRYAYPRWLRERLGNRTVMLAELTGLGDFKGAYPYPFYYAFTTGPSPEWIAAWGGNPRAPSFQWRED